MVIMNLNKKSKGEDVHIPFRNSMMTMILRDSLGGNCKTKMIADFENMSLTAWFDNTRFKD